MKIPKVLFQKLLKGGKPVSFCSEHGAYTEEKLCACYDKDGKKDGYGYLEAPVDDGDWGFAEGVDETKKN